MVAVYTLSVGDAVLAQEIPGIVLLVAALAAIRARVPALTRIVDAEQAAGTRPSEVTVAPAGG